MVIKNLNKMNKHETKLIIMSAIQTQSLLHTLDQMDIRNPYRQKKKLALSNYIQSVNKLIIDLELQQDVFCELLKDGTGSTDLRQSQNFIDCVAEFDKLAESINLK
jgi:hypothetical protein